MELFSFPQEVEDCIDCSEIYSGGSHMGDFFEDYDHERRADRRQEAGDRSSGARSSGGRGHNGVVLVTRAQDMIYSRLQLPFVPWKPIPSAILQVV